MNTRQMRTFAAVVRAGSFAKAAEQEYISSSALIQQIQTLEKEVGCSLLDRSPTGVRPSKAGQLFYNAACSVLTQLDEAIQQCQQIAREETLTLSVGFFSNSLPTYTPSALRIFQRMHPDVQINLVTTTLSRALSDVREGKLDICEYAFSEEIKNAGLRFSVFYSSPRYGFVAGDHPLARNSVLTREDLLHQKVAIHNFQWSPELVAWCRQEPVIDLVQIPCTTDTVYSTCLSNGIYLLQEDSIDKFPTLVAIPLSPAFSTEYGFAYRKDCKLPVRQFLNTIQAEFNGQ